MSHRCLIIDDEPLALDVLERYIGQIPSLTLVSRCNSAFEALQVLHTQPIDLIFVDIKMPEYSGIELIRSLARPPQIVLTTAFSDFAVESYELGVTDYLLKPFSFDRFLKAVNRAIVQLTSPGSVLVTAPPVAVPPPPEFVFLKADRQIHKVSLREIEYVEAYGNYVKVHLTNRMLLITDRISDMEALLVPHRFVRAHRSYVVPLDKIASISGHEILLGPHRIPVSSQYRKALLNELLLRGGQPSESGGVAT
ncbi:LytR/AlgR family response regulator transcription factor [Hymenobacter terrenus]|uniref:LytR/AlgR family response regulator transcription factor n=1 Tax=Hymenobacter terrenus TaxID=1629124 RepID=UPI000619570F|nr:LytTR family DNA-binding domain-containing protein [Hymenobacter terrenus]